MTFSYKQKQNFYNKQYFKLFSKLQFFEQNYLNKNNFFLFSLKEAFKLSNVDSNKIPIIK